jgi:hypothetical protein
MLGNHATMECDVHAVGQQSQQRKCSFTTVAGNEHARNNGAAVEVFSLGSVPVITSCNSRGIGDGVVFVVRSQAI